MKVLIEKKYHSLSLYLSYPNFSFNLHHMGNSLLWCRIRHTHTVQCRLDKSLSKTLWLKLTRQDTSPIWIFKARIFDYT